MEVETVDPNLEKKNNEKNNEKNSNICWNYAKGNCRRGTKCKWLHSKKKTNSKPRKRKNKSKKGKGKGGQGKGGQGKGKKGESNHQKEDHDECWDFAKGNCRRGEKCKWLHADLTKQLREFVRRSENNISMSNSLIFKNGNYRGALESHFEKMSLKVFMSYNTIIQKEERDHSQRVYVSKCLTKGLEKEIEGTGIADNQQEAVQFAALDIILQMGLVTTQQAKAQLGLLDPIEDKAQGLPPNEGMDID